MHGAAIKKVINYSVAYMHYWNKS